MSSGLEEEQKTYSSPSPLEGSNMFRYSTYVGGPLGHSPSISLICVGHGMQAGFQNGRNTDLFHDAHDECDMLCASRYS